MRLTAPTRSAPAGKSSSPSRTTANGHAFARKSSATPLNALDDDTHEEICCLLAGLQKHTGVTVLHVTHSRREARRLGQRVYLFKDGAVREISPKELTIE